jgi:hypothetical protein
MRPSDGRMSNAFWKKIGYRSALKASNAPMETIRSTVSSNSSYRCSRTSALREVASDDIKALLYSYWLRVSVIPIMFDVELLDCPP